MVAAPLLSRLLLPVLPKKVLGKLAFRLPVLAPGSISLASEVSQYSQSSESTVDQTFSFRLVIGSASSSSSGGKVQKAP